MKFNPPPPTLTPVVTLRQETGTGTIKLQPSATSLSVKQRLPHLHFSNSKTAVSHLGSVLSLQLFSKYPSEDNVTV